MKKIVLTFISFFLFYNSFALENVSKVDGNQWIQFTISEKNSYIMGFLSGLYTTYINTPRPLYGMQICEQVKKENLMIEINFLLLSMIDEINNRKNKILKYESCRIILNSGLKIQILFSENIFNNSLNIIKDVKNQKFFSKVKKILNVYKNIKDINSNKLCKDFLVLEYVSYLCNEWKSFLTIKDFIIFNTPIKQIVDGLDEFYKDFSNRKIRVIDSIYIINRQINGEDEEIIERIIKYLKTGDIKYLFIYNKNGIPIKIISFPP